MIRKEYLLAALLTAAGAAGGYWLLPEEADVARMAVRDYNYTAPKQHYDSELEKGKDDVETVQQLVRINTNTGDVDRAIEVLETYVKEHPEDDKALKQLGELYQFAQRYEDYMAILEARAKEHESPVVLQEMAQLYNFFQQKDKQKDALNRLYLVENGKNPETLQQLSVFAAIDKDYANTAKWLDELLELDPEAYTQDDAIRHVNALLEENRPDDA
ncbi:MAG: tetratricopeptide repeat protein, partial [Rickettsiales bacterium]